MRQYPAPAVERAMKVQAVIPRAAGRAERTPNPEPRTEFYSRYV
jgi:hypothetical protein